MSIALGYCRDCSGRRKLSIAARAGARVPLCEGCLGLAGLPALAWKDLTPAEKMACAESVLARESRPRKAALKKDGARPCQGLSDSPIHVSGAGHRPAGQWCLEDHFHCFRCQPQPAAGASP